MHFSPDPIRRQPPVRIAGLRVLRFIALVTVVLVLGSCGGAETAAGDTDPTAEPVAAESDDTPQPDQAETDTTSSGSSAPEPTAVPVVQETPETVSEPTDAESAEPTKPGVEEPGASIVPAGSPGCGTVNPPIETQPVADPISTNRDAELGFVQWFDVPISEEYELSGLALGDDGTTLWTVSDVSSVVLRLGLDGSVQCELPAPSDDLEGIAIHPSGEFLYIAHEAEAEIFKVDITTGEVLASARLPEMANYEESATEVEHGGDNKSIEGIAFAKGSIFLLKEGDPGLMMQVSEDLTTFLGYRSLHGPNGFIDDQVPSDKIDFAGLSYDPTRDAFWIVSDRGRRVFLYSWDENQVYADPEIRFAPELGSGTVEKAEGLAVDIGAGRFYVMSEVANRLYIFDLINS